MEQKRKEFGKRVRQRRKRLGVGLRELARKVDMDYSNLSRIERGQRPPPDLNLVMKIAEELGIDRAELLSLAGAPDELIANDQLGKVQNWIRGKVTGKSGSLTEVDTESCIISIVDEPSTDEVLLGLRPEDITLYITDKGFSNSSARNRIKGTIIRVEEHGNYNLAELDCGSFSLKVAITDTSVETMDLSPGKEVYATFKATAPIVKDW
ncbi:MAG: TOBE domain-containing protein [Candidatus Bipolaricaulota bacterium]